MSLQRVKFQSEGPLSYKAYAEDAAGLEFKGLWDEAKKLWGIARRVAKSRRTSFGLKPVLITACRPSAVTGGRE